MLFVLGKWKIMKHIIGIIIISLTVVLSGCIDTETPSDEEGAVEYWTWELSANEWVNITFTSQMINCTGSDEPRELFDSIMDIVGRLSVFQEYPAGNWGSWLTDRLHNNLEHIQPDILCQVYTEKNCTLRIEKC